MSHKLIEVFTNTFPTANFDTKDFESLELNSIPE